ncbi:hypothetical protein Agabi119p4_3571 [Agaricus bisporus var. burnettii]|uniref:COX assembly mitochondrial protein n=1 Tax=Agaricus bisporus var. burnettii TaxID=192524 RepID=A0A8H7F520_AGABI|nr:hypothetical protein Agabi119p4_3571 [Agaricus bisporus var. burnettii]
MHPQLSDKRIICKDFIKALEECHATGWRRFTGACNKQKDELNRCLRTERVARSARTQRFQRFMTSRILWLCKNFPSQDIYRLAWATCPIMSLHSYNSQVTKPSASFNFSPRRPPFLS